MKKNSSFFICPNRADEQNQSRERVGVDLTEQPPLLASIAALRLPSAALCHCPLPPPSVPSAANLVRIVACGPELADAASLLLQRTSCKLLPRRCTTDSIFAPFFPSDEPHKFAIVHKVFDNFKDPFDPNDNHVGLDINGVVSNATANLTVVGIEITTVKTTNKTVWVDYDGAARVIRIYMAVEGKPKPADPVLRAPLDLGEFMRQYSYIGFAASTGTGTNYELNCVRAWNLTVEIILEVKGIPAWKLGIFIGVPEAAAMLLVGLLVVLYMMRRKVRDDPYMVVTGTLNNLPGMPREFEFGELKKATNNFDEKMKLGQGGFGAVFRGVLQGENREVAVKKFLRGSSGQDDFLSELTIRIRFLSATGAENT